MQIDCYGFDATSEFFKRKKLEAHLVKTLNGKTYVCYGTGTKRPIHRLDREDDGALRIMWAWGAWADADHLNYVPINETLEITEDE